MTEDSSAPQVPQQTAPFSLGDNLFLRTKTSCHLMKLTTAEQVSMAQSLLALSDPLILDINCSGSTQK